MSFKNNLQAKMNVVSVFHNQLRREMQQRLEELLEIFPRERVFIRIKWGFPSRQRWLRIDKAVYTEVQFSLSKYSSCNDSSFMPVTSIDDYMFLLKHWNKVMKQVHKIVNGKFKTARKFISGATWPEQTTTKEMQLAKAIGIESFVKPEKTKKKIEASFSRPTHGLTYEIGAEKFIKCLVCNITSYRPDDIKDLYCKKCSRSHVRASGPTYKVKYGEKTCDTIKCLVCNKTSSNSSDIENLYCSNCNQYHGLTYQLICGGKEIICLRCNQISNDPDDIKDLYCKNCGSHVRASGPTYELVYGDENNICAGIKCLVCNQISNDPDNIKHLYCKYCGRSHVGLKMEVI